MLEIYIHNYNKMFVSLGHFGNSYTPLYEASKFLCKKTDLKQLVEHPLIRDPWTTGVIC